jgi:hypothetical protein
MGLDFLAMVLDHHPDVRAAASSSSSSSSRGWAVPQSVDPNVAHARTSNEQGALLVEEEDGLETLENLQYNQNEVISSKATQLVRKYYGDVRSSLPSSSLHVFVAHIQPNHNHNPTQPQPMLCRTCG